jgi:response regulator RpfG family c-di-GMP phosphodiesterase
MRLKPALDLIQTGSGAEFDPGVVEAFFAAKDEILQVRRDRKQRNRRSGHSEKA